ncbi:BON domain-containing protein [Paraburkholderia sp. LEh10]|jgi:osmotically-inducible protein OsmY|uniref:BON domain-containing protein n=1 Tax=Paraburkholderia sp. LEh10 TaxID=2821353 RepID=UPI001AEAB98B|nr:BON domain-containing protein [Paraburkholderia sp. LEh10]MBP0590664.1 BON domain-containing protein [Paraburkholderia sp. LEh10]
MKSNQAVQLAVATLIVVMSTNAWSQSGQTASAPANAPGASATAASGAVAPANGKKADRALRRKVYAAIGKQKEISAGNISVTAKNGAVTLNGSVTDASQIDKVVEITKGVPGVTSVTNKLTVQKPFGGM